MSSMPPTRTPESPQMPKTGIDRQDVLLVVGVVSLLSGIALWSVPGALVVLGAMCLGAVVLIERSESSKKETK